MLVAAVHFIGLGLAAWGLLRGTRRIKAGENIIDGALSLAVVVNLLAFMCSNLPHTQWDSREIAVTLPYGAVLAGRLLPGTLGKRAAAIDAFGKPQATYRYAAYTIMVWPGNLFARLRRPSAVTSAPWIVGK